MNYLLPDEDSLLILYLENYYKRISKFNKAFKQNRKTKRNNFSLVLIEELHFLIEELHFLLAIIPAYVLHSLPVRFNNKYFLDAPTLSLLLIKYLDLDLVSMLPENDSLEKDAYYMATRYYLEDYLLEEQEISQINNIGRIEGYLEAYDNLCEIQDWERAEKIINIRLQINIDIDIPVNDITSILNNWGYQQKEVNLYSKLWQYSELNSDYYYFMYLGNLFRNIFKYKEAIDCYLKALQITKKKKKYFKQQYDCLNSLGEINASLGYYELAIKYHKKALNFIVKNKKIPEAWNKFWHNHTSLRTSVLFLITIAFFVFSIAGSTKLVQLICGIIFIFFGLVPDVEIARNKLADTLNKLGYVYFKMAEYEAALNYYQDALKEVSSNRKNSKELIDCLSQIGDVYLQLGDAQNSIIYYQDALQVTRNRIIYNKRRQAGILISKLGYAYLNIGNYSEAKQKFLESLSYFIKIEYREGEASTLNYLGIVHFNLGEYHEAIKYYQKALSIYQELEAPVDESTVTKNLKIANEHLDNQQNKLNQEESK